jgi:hypothetical protein
MKKIKAISCLLLALWLSACSIEVSDPTRVPVPTFPTPLFPTPSIPVPTAALTPIPTTLWPDLDLTGQIVFMMVNAGKTSLVKLDLVSGALDIVFQPPENAWITAVSAAPDNTQLLLAYAPPPAEGQIQYGYTGLYLLPGECVASPGSCGSPTPVVDHADLKEAYFNPNWSPDGQYLYYTHFVPVPAETGDVFTYRIERMAYPSGEPEVLVDDAIWPRLSPDGTKLVYVSFATNELFVADADGQNSMPVLPPDSLFTVDAPLFSADGSTIIFSSVNFAPVPRLSWLEHLMGVQIASASPEAHNVPSDWWRVPATGGTPERLTEIMDTGMYADHSPDGNHLAFISATGLYVMKPDGSDLVQLLNLVAFGTMDWIP